MRIKFDWKVALISIVLACSVLLAGCAPASLARSAAQMLRESLVEATPTRLAPLVEQQSVVPTRTPTPAPLPTAVPAVGSVAVTVASDEELLVALYERVNRSVVNIAVVSRVQSSSRLPGVPGLPTPTPSPDQYQRGEGSGFVYDKQGHIITNNHVVAGADQVRVTFSDDYSVLATVVGADADSDLAVIKVDVDPARLYPLSLGDSDALRVGQKVVAIGNPFGLEGTMTSGIISGLGRVLPAGSETSTGGTYNIPDIVQTDAAINPGNSGGPLLNYAGEVVAVNTAIESPVRGFAGVGYGIPSNLVKKVVPVLIEKGSYTHPWLGISGMTLVPEFAQAMKLSEDQRGVLIGTITPDSPAARAGLRGSSTQVRIEGQAVAVGGDIIVAVDGEPVRKFDDLLSYLARKTVVGQKITLTVLRDGRTVNVDLTLAARPGRS
jgi:S1-C subfamily serine protease